MNLQHFVTQFANNATTIEGLVRGISDTQARWKPSPADRSILEVINHLYDEERDDFRLRLDLTLHQPDQEWPDFDPAQWVIDRRYNERDLGQSLVNFLNERQHSLTWLNSLGSPDWKTSKQHPSLPFQLRAGDLLAAWLAHDFLHVRQLNELRYQYLAQEVEPYSVLYAGEW